MRISAGGLAAVEELPAIRKVDVRITCRSTGACGNGGITVVKILRIIANQRNGTAKRAELDIDVIAVAVFTAILAKIEALGRVGRESVCPSN